MTETTLDLELDHTADERPEKHRNYIVLDSSFVLDTLINRNGNCNYFNLTFNRLKELQFKSRIRVPRSIMTEIVRKTRPYTDPRVVSNVDYLKRMSEKDLVLEGTERPAFFFLFKQFRNRNDKFAAKIGKPPLSLEDCYYCAYGIMKSRAGDVIAATKDRLISILMNEVYGIVHKTFVNQGYPDTKLYFARNINEVEEILKGYSVPSTKRL